MSSSSPPSPSLVELDIAVLASAIESLSSSSPSADLSKDALAALDAIESAFGPDGLGAVAVRGVPGFPSARRRLLPLARQLAALPSAELAALEVPERHYQFGWSHGKETLEDGSADLRKGSFYANPFGSNSLFTRHKSLASHSGGIGKTDQECDQNNAKELHNKDLGLDQGCHTSQNIKPDNMEGLDADAHLSAAHNVWPENSLPELRDAVETVSEMMRETAALLARVCDAHLLRHGVANSKPLARVTSSPTAAKGRLLYYFPSKEASNKESTELHRQQENWCGWHRDHGSITCLTKAMYFDETNDLDSRTEVANVQDHLRIRTRSGLEVSVQIPEDCIAFQIGQAAQVESGCWLMATPHAVSMTPQPHLSRCTYALFLQPSGSDVLQFPTSRAPGVPMPPQYQDCMTFGAFTQATLNMIYRHEDDTQKAKVTGAKNAKL